MPMDFEPGVETIMAASLLCLSPWQYSLGVEHQSVEHQPGKSLSPVVFSSTMLISLARLPVFSTAWKVFCLIFVDLWDHHSGKEKNT